MFFFIFEFIAKREFPKKKNISLLSNKDLSTATNFWINKVRNLSMSQQQKIINKKKKQYGSE
jgi:hypothetical protein